MTPKHGVRFAWSCLSIRHDVHVKPVQRTHNQFNYNKCSKIYTASSACLNDWTTNTIDFIFRIFKLNKNIFFCILAIHHTQDQIILALRVTDHDEVVAALYLVATRQEKARPSPESVGSITSRYSGNDPTLHSRRGGTRQTQESGGKFEPIESVQNVA